jgi:hypothetical protein
LEISTLDEHGYQWHLQKKGKINSFNIPHTPKLLDSLSTDNFGKNLNKEIASLFLVTHFITCDIVS